MFDNNKYISSVNEKDWKWYRYIILPFENGAAGFIHLEDRVVWYRIWSINIPLVATPLFQAQSI
jgi:hypothetical protein